MKNIQTFKIYIPVKPVPASRPRVSKYGTYYLKGYTDFRKEFYNELKKIKDKYPSTLDEHIVDIEVICHKPKKPSNSYPRGDADNFCKGILDGLTYAGMFWEDDIQVVGLYISKRYQRDGEDYGINIKVERLKSI